jgi:inosose dehydratase
MVSKNPRLLAGHTGITWADPDAEAGIKYIAQLGFNYIEVFAWVLKNFHDQGRDDICKKYDIPLISSYYSIDIVNPALRDAEMEKLGIWTDIVANMGGRYATFGGNAVDRRGFTFGEHKKYIVDFVDEAAKRLEDKGMMLNFHPHTGTPVESEDEIRSFLDAVDTRYSGFAPDVGQIQKGGADPLKLLKDYLSIIRLVHFKDFSGVVSFDADGKEIDSTGYACYSPLGQGVVNLTGILELLENSDFDGPIMVELDKGVSMPLSSEEAVTINKKYLENLGYHFVNR